MSADGCHEIWITAKVLIEIANKDNFTAYLARGLEFIANVLDELRTRVGFFDTRGS